MNLGLIVFGDSKEHSVCPECFLVLPTTKERIKMRKFIAVSIILVSSLVSIGSTADAHPRCVTGCFDKEAPLVSFHSCNANGEACVTVN